MGQQQQMVVVIGDGVYAAGLADVLRHHGYPALAVTTDRHSLDLLATLHPRAFIIDLMAANRDNYALLHRLRANPLLASAPILISSPGTLLRGGDLLDRELRALGARPLLDPHDIDALLAELSEAARDVA